MTEVTRREALGLIAATACTRAPASAPVAPPTAPPAAVAPAPPVAAAPPAPTQLPREVPVVNPVKRVIPLGFVWETLDPFLFCVHHDDAYPVGNARQGPAVPLTGRDLGQDFGRKDGWSMYHGLVVPGFPSHPHRGFETVTVVRRGLVDHSDSLGATARYGGGDVQWLTAGRGIQHAEMFPLVAQDADNPMDLFQIWLNLPRADKFAEPHFKMLWNESIPRVVVDGGESKQVEVTVIAGAYGDTRPGTPPPSSWAARADTGVVIWTVKLQAGARWTVPATAPGRNRMLYVARGGIRIEAATAREVQLKHGVELASDAPAPLVATVETELLLLEGRPIGEPVVQHGPFVMNTREEIQTAFLDYRRTQFGGWPWPAHDPVHARDAGRFAKHADGRVERAG